MRYQYNLRDISPRYRSSQTLLQRYLAKQNNKSPQYIVAAKFVVSISPSDLRFNDLLNEAIVYDESVSVYVMGTVK